MNVVKGDSNQAGSKKRQTAFKQIWKPISTEAASTEEKVELDDSVCIQSSSVAGTSKEELVPVVNVKDGKCSITMEVDTPLIRFVKGKDGSVQKQIEEELQIKIIFPSSKEDTSLVLEGSKVENLAKASERIKQVLEEAVKSPMLAYSHFISLPLVYSDLVKKLNKFQSIILGEIVENDPSEIDHCDEFQSKRASVQLEVEEEKNQVRVEVAKKVTRSVTKSRNLLDLRIDKSIFVKPETLHLTVLMLKLWSNDRVASASDVLQRISSKVLDALENRPISIQLKGLTCMKGSPSAAQVVYASVLEVGEEGRLVRACQVIRDAFVESGLVVDKDAQAQQTLKLHATLMNVRYRKSAWKRWDDSFDARQIFNEYGSEDWGEYPIHEIHLSQRFKFDESGCYHCCSSIALPGAMPHLE